MGSDEQKIPLMATQVWVIERRVPEIEAPWAIRKSLRVLRIIWPIVVGTLMAFLYFGVPIFILAFFGSIGLRWASIPMVILCILILIYYLGNYFSAKRFPSILNVGFRDSFRAKVLKESFVRYKGSLARNRALGVSVHSRSSAPKIYLSSCFTILSVLMQILYFVMYAPDLGLFEFAAGLMKAEVLLVADVLTLGAITDLWKDPSILLPVAMPSALLFTFKILLTFGLIATINDLSIYIRGLSTKVVFVDTLHGIARHFHSFPSGIHRYFKIFRCGQPQYFNYENCECLTISEVSGLYHEMKDNIETHVNEFVDFVNARENPQVRPSSST